MKAIIQEKYGGPEVLELKEVEAPIPKDDEVLVRIHAASLNAYDWHMVCADPFLVRLAGVGLFKPKNKIPGIDMAGTVESVGEKVTQFSPDDEVFGDICECGGGALAEYVAVKEKALVLKPANISFEEAAAVPMAAVTALKAVRDAGKVQPGQKVLVNGASGGVGTYAVQIAKAFGAEVTAVCSTGKLDLMSSLGADHVIDYKKENFTKNGKQYDLIVAANGYHWIGDYKRALSPNGVHTATGGSLKQIAQAGLLGPLVTMFSGKKMANLASRPGHERLGAVKALLEAGKVKPVIDRIYPLSEGADAFRYLLEGHPKGKIVVAINTESRK
jgi:NADPH:quinone reductase-like Zn-dependent oxidoreductase